MVGIYKEINWTKNLQIINFYARINELIAYEGTFILRKCYSELVTNASSAAGEFVKLACSRWEYDRSSFVSTIVSEVSVRCFGSFLS